MLEHIPTAPLYARQHRRRRPVRRLTYRNTFTPDELNQLVEQIGAERLLAALDRCTQPRLPLVAAE